MFTGEVISTRTLRFYISQYAMCTLWKFHHSHASHAKQTLRSSLYCCVTHIGLCKPRILSIPENLQWNTIWTAHLHLYPRWERKNCFSACRYSEIRHFPFLPFVITKECLEAFEINSLFHCSSKSRKCEACVAQYGLYLVQYIPPTVASGFTLHLRGLY